MTVALGTTLINKKVSRIDKDGWFRIVDARVNGSDIFIGACVTKYSETSPDIDLCAEIEALFGIVIGLNTGRHTLPDNGMFYNDYDNPFTDNYYVRVGLPKPNGYYLVLSETNTTIAIGNKLKVVDGVLSVADTNDNFQFIAEEAVTAAANTRYYFWARFVKS